MATWGSAGDLFPVLRVADELKQLKCDVRIAAPRSAGLYLRALGLPSIAVGDGSEMRAFSDPEVFTRARGGWQSWRTVVDRYIRPSLATDTQELLGVLKGWMPDLVCASTFAAPARRAAQDLGIPVINMSIYPQHAEAAPTEQWIEEDGLWGTPPDMWLHDRTLIDTTGLPGEVVGYPSWDELPSDAAHIAAAERWSDTPGPRLLMTLGSFLGGTAGAQWTHLTELVGTLGDIHTLVVGGSAGPSRSWQSAVPHLTSVGYVPLSRFLPRADVVVHHGGLGTTIAAIRAGVPSVVLPHAFDQPHNAQLVEALGLGVDVAHSEPTTALGHVIEKRASMRARAQRVAEDLVPPDLAASTACSVILRRFRRLSVS